MTTVLRSSYGYWLDNHRKKLLAQKSKYFYWMDFYLLTGKMALGSDYTDQNQISESLNSDVIVITLITLVK